MEHSLVLMGEIGGNDYNHALLAGKSIDEVETYVPLVVDAITSAINVRTYTYPHFLILLTNS